MHAWRELKTDAAQRIAEIERRQKAGTEWQCGCTESLVSGRSHDADVEVSPENVPAVCGGSQISPEHSASRTRGPSQHSASRRQVSG
jgi:hypothetical protein